MTVRPIGGYHLWSRFVRWCHLVWNYRCPLMRHYAFDETTQVEISWYDDESEWGFPNTGYTFKDKLTCTCGKVFYQF